MMGALAVGGCGGTTELEMFGQSNAALVEHLGEACELYPLSPGEVTVETQHPACEPGYCVGEAGQPWTTDEDGLCTCRCDGPAGTGPLCDCADGFVCKELIKAIGDLVNPHLVGSYCVPQ